MNKKININLKTILEYIAVILILLTSNLVFYYQGLSPSVAIFLYFAFSLYFCLKHHLHNQYKKISFLYIIGLVILVLLSFLYHPHLNDNQIFGVLLQAVSSALIISNFNYNRFKIIILNVVCILGFISLFLYILYIIGFITPYVNGNFTMYGPLVLGWDGYSFGRLAGFYHEPGAYQIILNTVLILYINEITQWFKLSRKTKFKLIIVLISLFLTKSTAGYITVIIIAFSCFYKKIFSKYFIPIIGVLIFFTYIIWNSDVVQRKLFPEPGDVSISLEQRTLDNLGMMKMISEEPILGYGLGSVDYKKRAFELGNYSDSNGILFMGASLGVFWFLLYFYFMFFSIKKMQINASIILIMFAYGLLQCNERFVEFPISYIFLFPFGSYRNINFKLIKK